MRVLNSPLYLGLLGLTVVSLGCSKQPSQKVLVTTTDSEAAKMAPAPQGIIIKDEPDLAEPEDDAEEPSVERLAMQTKQERYVMVRPGETIRLFQEWSGIPIEELKLLNSDKLPSFGNKYTLSMTAAEFSDFERKREDYWTTRKNELYDKYEVKAKEYIVKKGDTLDGISRKFKVPLWFIVMHNQALNPYQLGPGTKLIVPALEDKRSATTEGAPRPSPDGGASAEREELAATESDADKRDVFPIIVKPRETAGLYAKWGQISLADIKKANRQIGSLDKLRVGDTVNLPLTAKQFNRFQELRKEHHAKKDGKKPGR